MSLTQLRFYKGALWAVSFSMLCACASGPKVSKNPAEEAALQEKAKKVLAAGPSESAKNGGYDAIPFWTNRSETTGKYTDHVVKQSIFARSKKMYIVDFKVKFVRDYRLDQKGGLSFFDKLAERSKTTYGLAERRTYVGRVLLDDALAQKITDDLLADFKSRMTGLGFELIDRDKIAYEDLKTYLASDSMIASPQDGEQSMRIFAPSGWKLEKSSYDTPSVTAGFGDSLIKLGEQVSRKVDDGIAIAPTYIVSFGGGQGGKFAPYLNLKASFATAQKYTFGSFEIFKNPIQDGVAYTITDENKGVTENSASKAMAAVSSLLTQTSSEYTSTELHEIKLDSASFKSRLTETSGHLHDIVEEHVRVGRDD